MSTIKPTYRRPPVRPLTHAVAIAAVPRPAFSDTARTVLVTYLAGLVMFGVMLA